MILTASGDTTARAQVVAKFLKEVGRTEIPIGVGVPTSLPVGPLFAWAQDMPLSSYPGTVYFDGVAGAIDIIQGLAAQGQTVDIIAIAPCTNFPSLLQRYPDVVNYASVKVRAPHMHLN